MRIGVYAIKDKLNGFLNPTFEMNDDIAIRNFKYACLNQGSMFNFEPEDYSLYKISEFDSETGIFYNLADDIENLKLVDAISLVKKDDIA